MQSNEAILTMTMTATDTQSPAIRQHGHHQRYVDGAGRFPATTRCATSTSAWRERWPTPPVGLGYDFSKMLAQNPGAGAGPGRHGQGDAEAGGRANHAGDAHGHHETASRCRLHLKRPRLPLRPGRAPATWPKQGMSSAISSRLGGFGGFGKKKQQTPPPDPDQNAAQAQADQRHPDGDADHDFQLLVGAGRSIALRRPGGYKQVQPPAQPTQPAGR